METGRPKSERKSYLEPIPFDSIRSSLEVARAKTTETLSITKAFDRCYLLILRASCVLS